MAGSQVGDASDALTVHPGGWLSRGMWALVADALTYVANFAGVGTYAVFGSWLGLIFGVLAAGFLFTVVCDSPPCCAF